MLSSFTILGMLQAALFNKYCKFTSTSESKTGMVSGKTSVLYNFSLYIEGKHLLCRVSTTLRKIEYFLSERFNSVTWMLPYSKNTGRNIAKDRPGPERSRDPPLSLEWTSHHFFWTFRRMRCNCFPPYSRHPFLRFTPSGQQSRYKS